MESETKAAELLTTQETAAILRIHPVTLRRARCERSIAIPYIKVGGAIRYRREDVDAYLDQHREGGAA